MLVHEVAHTLEANHKKEFVKIVHRVGLTGKATATVAGAKLIYEGFLEWEKALGPYPHAALNPNKTRKVQTTRMKKAECPNIHADGDMYALRLTRKHIERANGHGPICPLCYAETGEVVFLVVEVEEVS